MDNETIVTLISTINTESSEIGELQSKERHNDVFALKKAVRQTEFFQAASLGFKPEIVLKVNNFDYRNETECILEGQRFRIYRAYPIAKTEKTELYLTAIVGDTNAFA